MAFPRIAIAHASYRTLGGSEYLSLILATELLKKGFEVTILSIDPPDPNRVKRMYDVDISTLRIMECKNLKSVTYQILERLSKHKLSMLKRLILYNTWFKYLNTVRNSGVFDVIIETQSNLPSPTDISYIHYPLLLNYYSASIREFKDSLLRGLYESIIKVYSSRFRKYVPGKVLTNSSWTASKVYSAYGIVPDVVYPPISIVDEVVRYDEIQVISNYRDRDPDVIVTVSRICPEKNLHYIVEVASKLRDFEFHICGYLSPEYSWYFDYLDSLVKSRGLDNVFLHPNIDRDSLLELYRRAYIYLHPPYPEHFGIAIVEAIAMGAIPIVYRDGGGWTDIVRKISRELGYSSIEEVPRIIRKLRNLDQRRLDLLRLRGLRAIKKFNSRVFIERMDRIIKYVARVKGRL